MHVIKKLIRRHKMLYLTAVLFTILSVFINLYWNLFLKDLLNRLGANAALPVGGEIAPEVLAGGILIVLLLTASELCSYYLASCVCEAFAHDLRMGAVRYYLRSDIRTLSRLKVGEEQSAMQNELKDISDYFHGNLFSFMKQLGTFVVTVLFLLCQSPKLTLLSTLPVLPLIVYCFYSGRIIKGYTEQCQSSKKQMNGLAELMLELFPVIQVYDASRLLHNAMDGRIREWRDNNIRREKVSAWLMSLSGLLSFLPLLLLLGLGGNMVIEGEIGIGTFYIFINLSGQVSGFLQNMPNQYAGFRRFEASVGSLGDKLVMGE